MSNDPCPEEYYFDSLADLEAAASTRKGPLAFGHEGCVHKLLCQEGLFTYLAKPSAVGRIITPYVPQNDWPAFTAWLERLYATGWEGKLTLNDWGALSYAGRTAPGGITLGVGRLLNYSLSEVPYRTVYFDSLNALDNDTEEYERFVRSSELCGFANEYLCREVKRYRAEYVELSDGEEGALEKSIEVIRANGLSAYVHSGLSLASISRACQSARYRNLTQPDCVAGCNRTYELELEKVFDKHQMTEVDGIPSFFPRLSVHGNVFQTRAGGSRRCAADGLITLQASHYGAKHA